MNRFIESLENRQLMSAVIADPDTLPAPAPSPVVAAAKKTVQGLRVGDTYNYTIRLKDKNYGRSVTHKGTMKVLKSASGGRFYCRVTQDGDTAYFWTRLNSTTFTFNLNDGDTSLSGTGRTTDQGRTITCSGTFTDGPYRGTFSMTGTRR